MAEYVVNLERLQALNVTVDVESPDLALDKIKEMLENGEEIDWTQAHIDQTVGACLATGDGSFQVLKQKG